MLYYPTFDSLCNIRWYDYSHIFSTLWIYESQSFNQYAESPIIGAVAIRPRYYWMACHISIWFVGQEPHEFWLVCQHQFRSNNMELNFNKGYSASAYLNPKLLDYLIIMAQKSNPEAILCSDNMQYDPHSTTGSVRLLCQPVEKNSIRSEQCYLVSL